MSPASSPIYLILFIISSASLFNRLFFGIDFTDEFQHYLQFRSLAENNKLFGNDLFFQQSVYLLVYPVAALYTKLYGFENFLLFGRILHTAIAISFFIIIQRILTKGKFSNLYASIASATIVLSSVTIGVFSINYNSIIFLFFSIFMCQFLVWDRGRKSILLTPVVSVFANPFIALTMFGLIWIRLFRENQMNLVLKVITAQLTLLILLIYLASPFIESKLLVDSIQFTRAFDIGNALFGSKPQLTILLFIAGIFLFLKTLTEKSLNFILLLAFLNFIFFFLYFGFIYANEYKAFKTFSISFLTLTLMCKIYLNCNQEDRYKIGWFVLAIIIFSLSFAISSSNGLNQILVPLIISSVIIFFFDLNSKSGEHTAYITLVIPLLLLLHTLFDGYREKGAIFTTELIQGVPELKYIRTTPQKNQYIQLMSKEISYLKDEKVVLIGNKPINYIISDSNPETCMLFLRDNIKLANNRALRRCLKQKNPRYIVTFLDENKQSRLREEFFPIYRKCSLKNIKDINYELCEK